MRKITIITKCKELGCCDACCLRFVGSRNPNSYKNPHESINKYLKENASQQLTTENDQEKTMNGQKNTDENTNLEELDSNLEKSETTIIADQESSSEKVKSGKSTLADADSKPEEEKLKSTNIADQDSEPGKEKSESTNLSDPDSKPEKEKSEETNLTDHDSKSEKEKLEEKTATEDGLDRNGTSPPAKRKKLDICSCCLGILQESTWDEPLEMVKEQFEKKGYECDSFACALSAPIAHLLREKIIALHIKSVLDCYEQKSITPLKEAWKWSFGTKLDSEVNKTVIPGTNAPLLVTITIEYPDELEELEILKTTSPKLFELRRQQRKRFAIEFTRRSVEEALHELSVAALKQLSCTVPSVRAKCVSVLSTHVPYYLAGRYIKLSRELPQSPWILGGERMMESSVQEIIFEPIAKLLGMTPQDVERRLKFMSAGREDVDVRCLGDGRPFAIEILDPNRKITENELKNACDEISKTGKVIVKRMSYIHKEHLELLKKGEETKSKCYEALCIKLTRSEGDDVNAPITVTADDIAKINSYSNTDEPDARVVIQQRTPIRVLHRRPLLARCRRVRGLSACSVPGHPNLFVVQANTEAGTYIKEWVHGELGRTSPALGEAIGANIDILALDVLAINLTWPPAYIT